MGQPAFPPVVAAVPLSEHKFEYKRSENQLLELLHVSFIIGSCSVITLSPLRQEVAGDGA
jgi:hypothetical protein